MTLEPKTSKAVIYVTRKKCVYIIYIYAYILYIYMYREREREREREMSDGRVEVSVSLSCCGQSRRREAVGKDRAVHISDLLIQKMKLSQTQSSN